MCSPKIPQESRGCSKKKSHVEAVSALGITPVVTCECACGRLDTHKNSAFHLMLFSLVFGYYALLLILALNQPPDQVIDEHD